MSEDYEVTSPAPGLYVVEFLHRGQVYALVTADTIESASEHCQERSLYYFAGPEEDPAQSGVPWHAYPDEAAAEADPNREHALARVRYFTVTAN